MLFGFLCDLSVLQEPSEGTSSSCDRLMEDGRFDATMNGSQFVTRFQRPRSVRVVAYESGAILAARLLNSPYKMSVF